MKKLYILNSVGDIRKGRPTPEEIQQFIDGEERYGEQLGTVEVGDDGDIVATPLTEAELKGLRDEYERDQIDRLRTALDTALSLRRQLAGLRGCGSIMTERFTIHADGAPFAEETILAWAAEQRLDVVRESPPATGKLWAPTLRVYVSGDDARYEWNAIVCLRWPAVELGDKAIAIEGMSVGIAKAMSGAA